MQYPLLSARHVTGTEAFCHVEYRTYSAAGGVDEDCDLLGCDGILTDEYLKMF
jgi:hypothetical protein